MVCEQVRPFGGQLLHGADDFAQVGAHRGFGPGGVRGGDGLDDRAVLRDQPAHVVGVVAQHPHPIHLGLQILDHAPGEALARGLGQGAVKAFVQALESGGIAGPDRALQVDLGAQVGDDGGIGPVGHHPDDRDLDRLAHEAGVQHRLDRDFGDICAALGAYLHQPVRCQSDEGLAHRLAADRIAGRDFGFRQRRAGRQFPGDDPGPQRPIDLRPHGNRVFERGLHPVSPLTVPVEGCMAYFHTSQVCCMVVGQTEVQMRQTWRWFGPSDPATVADMAQAGVEGVVTALHHLPTGAVWTRAEIARRQSQVANHPDGTPSHLAWEVVESLPVSEDLKRQTGDWRAHLDAYRQSLENLAAAGIATVCYNFMPVLDWTRTDLRHRRPDGATAMRFDLTDFAAFDLHILARPGAAGDYPEAVVDAAAARAATLDEAARQALTRTVTAGLPGAAESFSLDDVRVQLGRYGGITPQRLRANLIDFLSEVVPLAERLGLRLCCHPDDPPWPLLGLPRVMSCEADFAAILAAVDSPANGVTLCTGSLGARADNDLPGMMARLGSRVHFLHLRNVTREGPGWPCSFYEDRHLEGGTDMVAVIAAILHEEARRRAEGRSDAAIPMRPDHGQDILDDLTRDGQPGYPRIGRLKGLAELRGIMAALTHPRFGLRP